MQLRLIVNPISCLFWVYNSLRERIWTCFPHAFSLPYSIDSKIASQTYENSWKFIDEALPDRNYLFSVAEWQMIITVIVYTVSGIYRVARVQFHKYAKGKIFDILPPWWYRLGAVVRYYHSLKRGLLADNQHDTILLYWNCGLYFGGCRWSTPLYLTKPLQEREKFYSSCTLHSHKTIKNEEEFLTPPIISQRWDDSRRHPSVDQLPEVTTDLPQFLQPAPRLSHLENDLKRLEKAGFSFLEQDRSALVNLSIRDSKNLFTGWWV